MLSSVFALHVVCKYACMCVCAHGDQRTSSGIILRNAIFLLGDRIPRWLRAHQLGYNGRLDSSMDLPGCAFQH